MSLTADIKNGNISSVYLFYGEEGYKKRRYKELLKDSVALNPQMNYNYFEGNNINFKEVGSLALTLPFFSEKRLIIVENSGLFKAKRKESQESEDKDFSVETAEKIIDELPDTTCLVFMEEAASPNKKLFKKIASLGVVEECSKDSEYEVKRWLAKGFRQANKPVRESTLNLLISMAGTDYDRQRCEYEKIIAYTADKDCVDNEDVLAVVSANPESKIFSLVDAMTEGNVKRLLAEYKNMISNRESPLYILAMIRRQFRIMLMSSELLGDGLSVKDIAKKLKMNEYPIKKAASYLRYFKNNEIEEKLDLITETEFKIKSGEISEQIGVELLMIEFAGGKK